jgi:capsular exopolysaccharide synthesis family protein
LPNVIDTKEALLQKKEAFRTLLNNTNFISPNEENKEGKIIFVTSSTKGEGKTFVSFNLAIAYADLNKKTILIGADCRNPQLHKYLNQNRKVNKGLTSYLYDYNQNWQDLICKTEEDIINLDVLVAGEIPPNPTLLLSNPRFNTLMTELKKVYDIILVDTAPTLLVSDTLIISKYAETTLYVVRAGVTEKKLINYCLKLSEDKKIINMGMVINGVDFSRSHGYGYGYNYGYGYGYGVDEIKKPWYKKSILGKLFSNES